jgi:site-specific recombinase XerD
MSRQIIAKLLHKTSLSQLSALSNLSKSYISQVKNGKRPASAKLIQILNNLQDADGKNSECQKTISQFLASRREGISPNTIRDYKITLSKSISVLGLAPTTAKINKFIRSLTCTLGGKYGYFKCIRAFYNWLYSPKSGLGYKPQHNPITWVEAPKRPTLILPSLSKEQVDILINQVESIRDKAIIALFTESGLRLSELTNIKLSDINWQSRIIRVLGKGNKEGLAPFGKLSETYLKQWLAEHTPNGNVWGINMWGVSSMLQRLEVDTGIKCNPHTFRRTFACLLRKAGIDCLTIKDLGRWESLEMVQRYTRSVTFEDSLKHYRAPLSEV